jgi:hypothetical protein
MSVVPIYVAELSPPQLRGRLTATFELGICTGLLLGYCSNLAFMGLPEDVGWRLMLGVPLPFALLLAASWLPRVLESPRWLVAAALSGEAAGRQAGPQAAAPLDEADSLPPDDSSPAPASAAGDPSPAALLQAASAVLRRIYPPAEVEAVLAGIVQVVHTDRQAQALSLLDELLGRGRIAQSGAAAPAPAPAPAPASEPASAPGSGSGSGSGSASGPVPGAAAPPTAGAGARASFLIGAGLAFFQQANGSEAMVMYVPTVLQKAGITDQVSG